MSYILIDAETRAPVPLPYDTESVSGVPMTIHNFAGPTDFSPEGTVFCKYNGATVARHPQSFGLCLVTEAEFMAEQSND